MRDHLQGPQVVQSIAVQREAPLPLMFFTLPAARYAESAAMHDFQLSLRFAHPIFHGDWTRRHDRILSAWPTCIRAAQVTHQKRAPGRVAFAGLDGIPQRLLYERIRGLVHIGGGLVQRQHMRILQ